MACWTSTISDLFSYGRVYYDVPRLSMRVGLAMPVGPVTASNVDLSWHVPMSGSDPLSETEGFRRQALRARKRALLVGLDVEGSERTCIVDDASDVLLVSHRAAFNFRGVSNNRSSSVSRRFTWRLQCTRTQLASAGISGCRSIRY